MKQIVRTASVLLLLSLSALFPLASPGADPAEPVSLRARAEAGEKEAQFELANEYFYGDRTLPRSLDLAAYWFRKAADQGLAEAQFNYALCLEQGFGTKKNVPEAMRYYRLAGAQNFAPALLNQAMILLYGVPMTHREER